MEHYHQHWSDREHLLRLDRPERETMMPKEPVLNRLDLAAGMTAADIGAGLGYFSFPMAERVGPQGRIVALDPSRAAREELESRAVRNGYGQVQVHEGKAEDTGLPVGSVDRVLWHTMYHEVDNRTQALNEMLRILRSGGLWVVVDWVKEAMEQGPPLEHRVSAEQVLSEVTEVGFLPVENFVAGPFTWGVVVRRP